LLLRLLVEYVANASLSAPSACLLFSEAEPPDHGRTPMKRKLLFLVVVTAAAAAIWRLYPDLARYIKIERM
jgi:hypothetical protein